MERPYVICHILSSLDGKITGPFMRTEAAGVPHHYLHLTEGKPVEFLLKETEKIGDGGLRLNYQAKNRKV